METKSRNGVAVQATGFVVRGRPGDNDEPLEWSVIARIRSIGRCPDAARRAWQQTTKCRGLQAAAAGRVTEAIRLLEQARLETGWPDHEIDQHLVELRTIRRLEKRLEVQPNEVASLVALGKAYFAQERSDEALATFRRAVALAPQHAEAHALVALELHFRGDNAAAASEYQEALRLQPTLALAAVHYASLLREQPPCEDVTPQMAFDLPNLVRR